MCTFLFTGCFSFPSRRQDFRKSFTPVFPSFISAVLFQFQLKCPWHNALMVCRLSVRQEIRDPGLAAMVGEFVSVEVRGDCCFSLLASTVRFNVLLRQPNRYRKIPTLGIPIMPFAVERKLRLNDMDAGLLSGNELWLNSLFFSLCPFTTTQVFNMPRTISKQARIWLMIILAAATMTYNTRSVIGSCQGLCRRETCRHFLKTKVPLNGFNFRSFIQSHGL